MAKKLRKRLFVLLYCAAFLLPVILFVQADAITDGWVKLLGTENNELGQGITADSADNIYVTGYTDGNLDGQINEGSYDIFLAKYDESGTKQWVKLLGTAGLENAFDIAIDSTNNVYMTGYTAGNLDGENNEGGNDIFLAKYNESGAKQWVKLLGTASEESGYDVAVDSTNNIYVTGYTDGDLDGQINDGGHDIFLAKYDTNGTRLWTKLLGTALHDYGYGVATDSTGNIYVTGRTYGNLDGQMNAGNDDIFLTKYDTNGTRLWTILLGTAFPEYGYGIVVGSTDNIYITGPTDGNLDGKVNSGGHDIFLAKYDGAGAKKWVVLLGTEFNDWGRRVTEDSSGNIYVTGQTYGNLDGQINAGSGDIFLAKYDELGAKQWVMLLGTAAEELGYSLIADSNDNIYVTGYTAGNLDGEVNSGGYDVFVWKQMPVSGEDSRSFSRREDGSGGCFISAATRGFSIWQND